MWVARDHRALGVAVERRRHGVGARRKRSLGFDCETPWRNKQVRVGVCGVCVCSGDLKKKKKKKNGALPRKKKESMEQTQDKKNRK